jgi:hypothetical protein
LPPTDDPLYQAIRDYATRNSSAYDSEFATWLHSVGYGTQRVIGKKQQIKDFYTEHGRLPEAKEMPFTWECYCKEGRVDYDPDFHAWTLEHGRTKKNPGQRKQEIKDFVETNGRLPSRYNKEESKMYHCMMIYCRLGNAMFDNDFATWYGEKKAFLSPTKEQL